MSTWNATPTPISRLQNKLLLALALAALTAPPAAASSIAPAAFISPIVTTFDGLGLPLFNDAPITLDGAFIQTSNGSLRYLTASTCSNECIGTDEDTGTLILGLAAPSVRAGLYVGLSAADVHFIDPHQVDLGAVSVSGNSTNSVFAGWDAGLDTIATIEVIDTESNSLIVSVDNLTTEGTPEPRTFFMLLGAFAAFPIVKSRRVRARMYNR
jgi:hypothetical protein